MPCHGFEDLRAGRIDKWSIEKSIRVFNNWVLDGRLTARGENGRAKHLGDWGRDDVVRAVDVFRLQLSCRLGDEITPTILRRGLQPLLRRARTRLAAQLAAREAAAKGAPEE